MVRPMRTKVRELRKGQGMSQQGLAQVAGVSLRAIQKIEAGTMPQTRTAILLAKALGCESIADLFDEVSA